MSRKPTKKSDQVKSWNLPRKTRVRPKRLRFMIVCEGMKTEPNYFDAFKRDLPTGVVEIDFHPEAGNTQGIVDIAKIYLNQKELGDYKYDQVWAVFDKDSFPKRDFDNAVFACAPNAKGKRRVECACSNEAFELWYLLHFDYFNTGMSRTEYEPRLSQYMGKEYQKNDTEMYAVLKDEMDTAIRNADRLEGEPHIAKPSPSERNPWTTVHHLVKQLKAYL